jgi:DNA (cytosine-5)-methyltransferase 1
MGDNANGQSKPSGGSAVKRKPQPKNFLRTATLESLEGTKLTAISLFSGCGGMDLGIMQAGFEVRVMIDNDKACCDTLACNFTDAGWRKHSRGKRPVYGKNQKREPVILHRDICKTSTAELLEAADLQVGECGVVTGGFPCQGFSTSGKREIKDPRNSLYLQCVRVVREALPRFFIFENVKGLISMGNGAIINRICGDLAAVGYEVVWELLNAADYGVPQHRERAFFIGRRLDMLVLPTGAKRPHLHMGVAGRYKHPAFFEKRHKLATGWRLSASSTGWTDSTLTHRQGRPRG